MFCCLFQQYFYEYSFDELRQRPRQVCPYAVVSFQFKGKDSPLPSKPLAPIRYGDLERLCYYNEPSLLAKHRTLNKSVKQYQIGRGVIEKSVCLTKVQFDRSGRKLRWTLCIMLWMQLQNLPWTLRCCDNINLSCRSKVCLFSHKILIDIKV